MVDRRRRRRGKKKQTFSASRITKTDAEIFSMSKGKKVCTIDFTFYSANYRNSNVRHTSRDHLIKLCRLSQIYTTSMRIHDPVIVSFNPAT